MGRHQASGVTTTTVITTTGVVLLAVALVVLLTPELPRDRVYVRDVRVPVPVAGPSYLPAPPPGE